MSDPAVVVNERAVTSRHRNEEYSSNPHPVSGSKGEVCRVTMGHHRVTIGHLRVTVGHPKVTIGHLKGKYGSS